jgi:hypothetical protein
MHELKYSTHTFLQRGARLGYCARVKRAAIDIKLRMACAAGDTLYFRDNARGGLGLTYIFISDQNMLKTRVIFHVLPNWDYELLVIGIVKLCNCCLQHLNIYV